MADVTPHIKELNAKLHSLGLHAVTAKDWYQMQADLARLPALEKVAQASAVFATALENSESIANDDEAFSSVDGAFAELQNALGALRPNEKGVSE